MKCSINELDKDLQDEYWRFSAMMGRGAHPSDEYSANFQRMELFRKQERRDMLKKDDDPIIGIYRPKFSRDI